jgi:nuclear cap-binding protein subunit 1
MSRRSATTDAMAIVTVEEGTTSAGAMVSLRQGGLKRFTRLTAADDNDNYSRDRGRGPQRRRNDDAPPRRRYEEPPFPKLRRLLLNIASSTKLPQDEAIEIAKHFGEHFDDERLRSDFFDVFVQL